VILWCDLRSFRRAIAAERPDCFAYFVGTAKWFLFLLQCNFFARPVFTLPENAVRQGYELHDAGSFDVTESFPARKYAMDGVRVVASGPVFYMTLTFLGIGGLAQQADVSLGFAVAGTLLIWAGPAQVIMLAAMMNGLALPAIALSVSLSSVRLVPMCVSLLPWLRDPKRPWFNVYIAHHIAVTSWVESIRRLPDMPPEGRVPYFLGLAHALIACATFGTIVGYLLAVSLPPQLAAGLLFVTPVYFMLALVRNASDVLDWCALGFGAAFAPISRSIFGSGFDLLATGLIAGTAAYLAQRYHKRRAAGSSKGGAGS
jgi:predicted branched-subunit amino acid permease